MKGVILMNDFFTVFLTSNEKKYRLLRTIVQGVIAVIIANLDLFVSYLSVPVELKPAIVALIMAILSPLMAELGASRQETQRMSAMTAEMVEEPEDSCSDDWLTDEEIAEYRRSILEMEGGDEDDL